MRFRSLAAGVLCLTAITVPAASASAQASSQDLQDAVSVKKIINHERALMSIAQRNGGTRASGTPGYDASANYVAKKLRQAGYLVSVQNFEFPFFSENAPSTLSQISPNAKDYVSETDFLTMSYSGSGDITAPVQAVDVVLPPAPAADGNTSGCEAADFAGFTPGNIALMQRGSCPFGQKAANAEAAGAAGVLIFNEGQPGRTEAVAGTLGAPDVTIPVLGASFAVGQELASGNPTVSLSADTTSEVRATSNVIADSQTGREGRTVVVGAHLDSVPEGPGINDNGSGVAGDLAIAEGMSKLKVKPRNRVRFAFWGAEESGLLGSQYYVDQLPQAERDEIMANLNFDMIGSPNYARFVYDGDGSDTPDVPDDEGPVGSDTIEGLFTSHFDQKGLESEGTAFDGRSDYGPFIAVGIPAGGLFTGAEGIKTVEQVARYGGLEGVAYDKCYHAACDTLNNLNNDALSEMSDAAAHATFRLASRKKPIYVLNAKTAEGQTLQQRKIRKRSASGGLELAGETAVR